MAKRLNDTVTTDSEVMKSRDILTIIWKLAWPSILLYLSITLAFFLTFKIVSPLGTEALAGISSGQRIYFLISSLIMGLGAGSTAMIAREWGRNNIEQASKYAKLSLLVGIIIGLFITLLFNEIAPEVSTFFRLEGANHAAATDYVRNLTHFAVFLTMFLLMGVIMRAISDAITPLIITAITNVILLILSFALTHGYWGLPQLGLRGAAIGTGVAYLIGTLVYIVIYYRSGFALNAKVKNFADRQLTRRLLKVATPGMLEQLLLQLSLIGFMWVLGRYSTAAFTAYGIGLSVFGVTLVCGIGFSVAGAALVGQQLGAGNKPLAIKYAHSTLHISLVFMIAAGVILFFLSSAIANFLSTDPEVIELTTTVLRLMALAQPLLAFDFAVGGALRGAGDTKFTLLTTIICYVFIRVLISYIFFKLNLSINWILSVLLFDYSFKALLLYWRLKSLAWVDILEKNEEKIPLNPDPLAHEP